MGRNPRAAQFIKIIYSQQTGIWYGFALEETL